MFESQEDQLIRSAARRLKGRQRRLFIAEVAIELCDGSARLGRPVRLGTRDGVQGDA